MGRSFRICAHLSLKVSVQDLASSNDDHSPDMRRHSGSATTLGKFLTQHLPLLFPANGRTFGYVLVQGVVTPLEAEMAWLGACLAGADGWVNIMVGVH
jgi:autophagy-related protein 5